MKGNKRQKRLHMGYMRLKLSLTIFFVVSACISCAGLFRSDIETRLIAEMEGNCKKVEIKMDYEGGVYVITYTGKVSKDKCPIALIQAWKNGALIKEKEALICRCREGTGK
jgi:hypothetical protein